MKIFNISPDDTNWGKEYKYDINATHKWCLPGLKCSACKNTWGTTGLEYPRVDLSRLPSTTPYCDPWPVPLEEFEKLKKAVLPLVPKEAPVEPGTEFGPLEGKAWGTFADFAWVNPWTMLVKKETLTLLENEGIKGLLPVTPELAFRSKSPPSLFELQIVPVAQFGISSYKNGIKKCSICGREAGSFRKVVLEKSSIPTNLDIFRAKNHATFILVTEWFVEVIKRCKFRDIIYRAVKVS
ncbi:MAG TPA: double-CXXCG motif protein [Candidatus Nitrosocosmicus sp.]|nr:double-CXXCG motif protein [Candidatus Nitrosocosmicus sp.]